MSGGQEGQYDKTTDDRGNDGNADARHPLDVCLVTFGQFSITPGVVFGQACDVCTVFGLMGIHAFTNNDARSGNFVRYQAEQGD